MPRRWSPFTLALCSVSLLLVLFLHLRRPKQHERASHFQTNGSSNAEERPLRVALPASSPNDFLCRTLLTLSRLGYPSPVLINWGQEYHQEGMLAGGGMLAKLEGFLSYLENSFTDHNSTDLVLFVDAYDVWFQLPPSVLLSRYHALTTAADERLASMPGSSNLDVRSRVLFGNDKGCAPYLWWHPMCYLQPESSLPDDLWGSMTDLPDPEGWDHLESTNRPRWLNSGFILGSAIDLKPIFRRAVQLKELSPFGSDQHILHSIFTVQEFVRELRRRGEWPLAGLNELGSVTALELNQLDVRMPQVELSRDYATNMASVLNPKHAHHQIMLAHLLAASNVADDAASSYHDFGIHIDYPSALAHQSSHADHDTRYFVYNGTAEDPEPFGDLSRDEHRDCRMHERIVQGELPDDILRSSGVDIGDGAPASLPLSAEYARNWTDVPLFTNLCSGEVPVVVHHNGLKEPRIDQWRTKDGELGVWMSSWGSAAARAAAEAWQKGETTLGHEDEADLHSGGHQSLGAAFAFLDAHSMKPMSFEEICMGQWFTELI